MSRPAAPVVALAALIVIASVGALTTGIGAAAPPPSPLLWERVYAGEDQAPAPDLYNEAVADCSVSASEGFRENTSAGPHIAVIGDSGENQNRKHALADPAIHWQYDTHCGEKFGSALSSGRIAEVTAAHPQVLVMALGNNDFNEAFQFRPDLVPAALANIQQTLDATESIPCRVFVNLPRVPPATMLPEQRPGWLAAAAQINAAYAAARSRPGVFVADWATRIEADWSRYTFDGIHLTHAGIDARMNLELATARRCWAPDSPTGLGAAPSFASASIWWNALPAPEGVTSYRVELSDGRTFDTTDTIVPVAGLTNGAPFQFRVRASNQGGTGLPSPWSGAYIPSAAGARFHAVSPTRVLDTRYGQGGKAGPFGPGERYQVDLSGVLPPGASAVAVNLTATGQSTQTFVTAWPGDQPMPLTSNLNPRPGVAAVPALATTRVGADRTMNLFNNTGFVHVIADVVGYYDAPGGAAGALYVPVAPTRLLDTRLAGGAKTTPFGTGERLTLPVPGVPADASGVVLNLTSTSTTAPGFVTVWPSGTPRPSTSNLNPQPGLNRANLTTAKLGTGGAVDLFNNSASTDLVVDLVGYYTAEGALTGGSLYYPITPERHVDSRTGSGGLAGPIHNGTSVGLTYTGVGSIPATGVTAVDANITVTEPSAAGHTTIWPGGDRPVASNLNYEAGETIANRDDITLAGGAALIWSSAPSTQYVVDVNGWFGPPL